MSSSDKNRGNLANGSPPPVGTDAYAAWLEPERVLAEQPAPMQEQPAPLVVVPAPPEPAIEQSDDETGAHDARFVLSS